MAIYEKTDKLQKWKYCTKEINLLIPGEERISIPKERLNAFSFIHDYENNAFPIFKIEIVLESSLYYKIIKHKDDVQFHLRIQSYYHYQDSETYSMKRDFINDTFDLILDDDSEDTLNSIKQSSSKNDYTKVSTKDYDNLDMVDNKVEFFLFKSSTIKGLKKNFNAILEKSTITDAIATIATTAGIKNILMSPAHNTTKYEELILPPFNCLHELCFIDTYYGIYKTGSLIYFDFDYSYILAYNGKCTAYIKNEIQNTCIVIPKQTTAHSTECGILYKRDNTQKVYAVGDYKTIGIRNDSVSNDVIKSNDIQLIDNYSGDITSTSSGVKTKGSNSTKIKENMTENPWLGNTYTAQTSANGIVIDVRLMDIDVNCIKPNKRFNMVFEDTALTNKYNDVYLLTYAEHTFLQDGSDFCVTSTIRLKKTS